MRRRQRRDAVRGSGPSLPAASYSSSWCPHHRVWRFLRPPPSFSRQLAARGAKTAILSTYPGEAATFQSGSCCPEPITVRGWPRDPSTLVGYSVAFDTVERAFAADRGEGDLCAYDLVLLALPAFAHDAYLNALAPWIEKSANAHAHRPPCVLAAAVAQGGFDLAARNALQAARAHKTVVVAGLETLPWTCRARRRPTGGHDVDIGGTKHEVDVAISVHPVTANATGDLIEHGARALDVLQCAVGENPLLVVASGFLGVSMMNINALWHPALMYHRWKNWDGRETFTEPPLLYEVACDEAGITISAMSIEVKAVIDALKAEFGDELVDDLHSVRTAHEWFVRSYGDQPGIDTTSVATMLRTNPAYKGLTHQMKPVEEGVQSDVAPRLVPDFKHRYLTEDMPYGLVVFRGVAELVGIPTPTIDTVISWAQTAAGKTYLAAAKPGGHGISETELPASPGEAGTLRLTGESVAESRCPQRYGFFELNWFMKNSGYVTTPSAGKNDDAGWFRIPKVKGSSDDVTGAMEPEQPRSPAAA